MTRLTRLIRGAAFVAALLAALETTAAAQVPPEAPAGAPARGPGRRGGGPPAALPAAPTNEQVYQVLDSFVLGRAQGALQLTDAQYFPFFQRMQQLQNLQRVHRRQRQRVLAELRQISGPNVKQPGDDASIVAKTKELDDLEARQTQEEQRALAEIDQVLQVRQRAMFRLFLEAMERQKLDLLLKARQGGRVDAPPPGPLPAGGRQQ